MNSLPINGIVDVNIDVLRAVPAMTIGCNKGMIVGSSTVISLEERVKSCKSYAEVAALGYDDAAPELVAAKLYFAQKPAPRFVYMGRHDSTVPTGEDPPPAETKKQAVAACLLKAQDAYGVYVCEASDADNIAVAATIDGLGNGMLFFDSENPDCLTVSPAAPDIFTAMKTAKADRAIGIYSLQDYAGAALMGVAMGHETGRDGSAFSLSYLNIEKLNTDSITAAQYEALIAKDGNVFALRGQNYKLLHMGRCVNGTPYDDVMYVDMTQNAIEARVMEVVAGNRTKLPQTDAGMAVINSAITNACEYMRSVGYIAEGVWNGDEIKDLIPGDVIAGGFMVFIDSFATMLQADREARKAPPIVVAIKTSGTIESVVINVNVNL